MFLLQNWWTKVIVHAPLIRVARSIKKKHHIFQHHKMATPRKRLIIILRCGKKGHLSSEERSMVMHALISGEKVSTLATRFRCHRNTIRNTMKRYCETNNLEDKPRTGAHPRLTIREERALFRRLRQNPEMPHAQL
jgi:hypothetical protein